MDDFNIYLIISPDECQIDQTLLKITKKLPYQLNIKNCEVALTEFTTDKFKRTFALRLKDFYAHGITFSNLNNYFTTRICIDDAPDQIEDQINVLCAAYYSYIYENLYHNLKNITKIPQNNSKDEIYLITNKNTDQTAIYTKNFKLDPKEDIANLLSQYYSSSDAQKYKLKYTNANTFRSVSNKIIIKEYQTHLTKEFISKKFEDYTTEEIFKLYEHYLEKLPEEFEPKKEVGRRRTIDVELKKYEKSFMIKLKLNPTFKLHPPKIYLVLQGGDHELIPEEELYFDNPKMTHLLIESDITPLQFVNNQLKNVLKIITYGDIVPYETVPYYYKCAKSFINTINITISTYSNFLLPEEALLKDNIYMNLHFRVRK